MRVTFVANSLVIVWLSPVFSRLEAGKFSVRAFKANFIIEILNIRFKVLGHLRPKILFMHVLD